jgi:hypothetical protein
MRRRRLIQGSLIAMVAVAVAAQVWAYPEFSRKTKMACAGCHVNPAGGAELSEAGKLFKTDNTKVPATGAGGAEYAGTNKCRICHMKQHKAWAETKHAKALINLKNADAKAAADVAAAIKVEIKGSPAQTEACVGCHVTGHQLAGGYPAADSVKTAGVSNVGCESCHGPGSKHIAASTAEKKKFISRSVTANMCMQCHTVHTSPKFNFEEYKKRGVHQVAAAATK